MRTRGWSTTGWMLAALACLLILVGGEYAWRTMICPSAPSVKTVQYEWKPQPGEPVKDFGLPDAKKKVHRLSDYKGQDFLLTFFCGCGECRTFTKDLVKAYKETGRDVPTVAVFTPGFVSAGERNWIDSTGGKFTYL